MAYFKPSTNTLVAPKISLSNLTSSVKDNVLYYDTSSNVVSYGTISGYATGPTGPTGPVGGPTGATGATGPQTLNVQRWSLDGSFFPIFVGSTGSNQQPYIANSLYYVNDTGTLFSTNFSGNFQGTSTSTDSINVISTSANNNYYIPFCFNTSGSQIPNISANFYYNPSTTILTTPNIKLSSISNVYTANDLCYNTSTSELSYFQKYNFLSQASDTSITNATSTIINAFDDPSTGFNANTGVYMFEMLWCCSGLSALSRTMSIGMDGTCIYSRIRFFVSGGMSSALTTNSASDVNVILDSTGFVVVTPSSNAATIRIFVRGMFKVQTAGTVRPTIMFNTNGPGASAVRTTKSYVTIQYIGSDYNSNLSGNWM